MKPGLATSPASAEPVSGGDTDWIQRVRGASRYAAHSLRKALSALRLPKFASNPGFASSVDIDAIARRLDADARGREDGKAELPPSDSDALSGTQAEIVHHFRRLRAQAGNRLARLERQSSRAADAVDVSDARTRIVDIPSRCRNEALRIKAEFQPRAERLAERESQQYQYYRAFREQNRLDRIANESHSPVVGIAFVAMLITLVTAFLSGLTFPAADGPRLLASGWALGIGVAAIALPFAFGAVAVRFINHDDAVLSLAAWSALLLAIVGFGAMLYASTYYLAYATTQPASTLGSAFAAMAADPWSPVADASAWRPASLVGAASLLALFVGYRADDPYPGYGEVQRAYYRARTDRERWASKLRHRINAMIDGADAEVVEISARLKSAVQQLGVAVDRADRCRGHFPDLDAALEDGCNIVLDRYRRANEGARSSPAPLCFTEHVCFRTGREIETPPNNERDQLQAIVDSMPEFEHEVARVRQSLRDLNSRSLYALDGADEDDDPGDEVRSI